MFTATAALPMPGLPDPRMVCMHGIQTNSQYLVYWKTVRLVQHVFYVHFSATSVLIQ